MSKSEDTSSLVGGTDDGVEDLEIMVGAIVGDI